MTVSICWSFYRLQGMSLPLRSSVRESDRYRETFSLPPRCVHVVTQRWDLLLSQLQEVLQGHVDPPLSLLHLPDVEVDVQWGAGGGGVTAVGVTDHLTEILGDVETPPLVDLKVGFIATLDQHHVVVGLDDRAVGIPTRKASWKNSTSSSQKKSGDRGVRKGQVGMRKFN